MSGACISVVYICKIKLIGFPFAVLTQEEADAWVLESPETNYYEVVTVQKLVVG